MPGFVWERGGDDCVGFMIYRPRLERPQRADYILYFILLEKADSGDASRSGLQARCGICQRDATEGNHGNPGLACFMQSREASGLTLRRVVLLKFLLKFLLEFLLEFLFKDRSKDGEVRFLRFGAVDFRGTVARGGYQKGFRVQWTVSDF